MSSPISDDELGVAALPDDATAAQRARAEALWRPTPVSQPCRCSGTGCQHGTLCDDCGGGYVIHADRYPGSLWELTEWADDYVCVSCGGSVAQVSVTLPDLPWGQKTTTDTGNTATNTFPSVRHPNFPDSWPGADSQDP